ncbi:MAG: VWA domain-containing protein [Gemmatimonadaceae bacterium]|nr:VWA domain-containing protein [Gemmatimonadaceae bacterium]
MLVRSVILAALLATPLAGQTVVTGTVHDAAGAPLDHVQLVLARAAIGTFSDARGVYRLAVPRTAHRDGDSVTVRATRPGFAAAERRVAARGDSVHLDFVMNPVPSRLEEVVTSSPGYPGDAAAAREPFGRGTADRVAAKVMLRGPSSPAGSRAAHGGAAREAESNAGVLTAAVWDDLAHWSAYGKYLDRTGQSAANPWTLDPSHATRPAAIPPGTSRSALDLGFLVDATGSMGDEMQFLQTELRDIVTRVHAAEPELDIRLSIVFYRDRGDEFVTRTLPFTRSVDTAIAFLEGMRADGGGDYPEDMNAGLAEMMRQDWSRDVAPRMLFVIGDAPPHLYDDERYTYHEAIRDASGNRIAIYPVAASGVDQPTEYLFRAMAAMTGGKYIFLTDDSGVGESHEKPDITGYEVEKLNELMVREIRKYVRGYLGTRAVAANGGE